MPKYLNHLNLNGNQLKNAKLEITDSPTPAKGIIHYHDTSDAVRVYTGTGNSDFFTLGDNEEVVHFLRFLIVYMANAF